MYLSAPGYNHPQEVIVNLLMHLKRCVFFEHLDTPDLIKLAQRMRTVDFRAGEIIIQEGESGNELFIVESGSLKCEKVDSKNVLKIYGKGEIFGELSLLYNNPRASTVTAIEGGRLFALSRPHFSAVLHLGMISKL
jgi:cAMP-dependent protein kinase regulator